MNVHSYAWEDKVVLIQLECFVAKKAVIKQIRRKHHIFPEEHANMEIIGWVNGEAVFGKEQHHHLGLVKIENNLFLINLNPSAWGKTFVSQFYEKEQIIVIT